MHLPRTLPLLGLALLLFAPARADACSCVGGIPLCQSFWATDAVFSGEVISIGSTPNPYGDRYPAHRLVRFRVLETFRGGAQGVLEVATGTGGGDCGYNFIQGMRYLMYAHAGKSGLSTGICSRTRLLAQANEDLSYIRAALAQPSATGRIFGVAQYQRQWNPGGEAPAQRFISGYSVTLTGGSRTRTTSTDTSGRYEFTGVAAGDYTVSLRTPETELATSSKVTLADPRGCATADFFVVPNGRIQLRLVDTAGNPLTGISLDVIDAKRAALGRPVYAMNTLETDDEGFVEFEGLHPGGYMVGINTTRPPDARAPFPRSFFPGVTTAEDARVIQLGLGERIDAGAWQLSTRLAERRTRGLSPPSRPSGVILDAHSGASSG